MTPSRDSASACCGDETPEVTEPALIGQLTA